MGFMTLEDYREEVNLGLGDHRQSGNRRLDSWINRAYVEVAYKTEQEWMKICNYFTTVIGQEKYALPPDFFAFISLKNLTKPRRLRRQHLTEHHRGDVGTEGLPKYYARRRDTLLLDPTPDGAYRMELYYYWNPPLLSDPGDFSQMGHLFDHAILLLSLRNGYLSLGPVGKDQATFYFQAAQAYLREMGSEREWSMEEEQRGIEVAWSEEDLMERR